MNSVITEHVHTHLSITSGRNPGLKIWGSGGIVLQSKDISRSLLIEQNLFSFLSSVNCSSSSRFYIYLNKSKFYS